MEQFGTCGSDRRIGLKYAPWINRLAPRGLGHIRVSLAFLILLAACSGCVRFEPKPLDLDRNVDTFQGRTLGDAGLRAYLVTNGVTGDWPRQVWEFKALTVAAFYYHPDLDVARAKWAVASAGKRTAG